MKCHYLVFIDRIILPQILSNYSKFAIRAVTRALNIGGGVHIHISFSALLISFGN